ncbi:TIGR03773 family transporter-associated surface protein [Rothia uropygioeca]|uniref:TIGR03773 family transporter-associated surface protein n=1 Tax=Kocuria sp. 257 TaxID=2021970 RepID=UPI0013ED5BFF|nr:TIGR03773 family transporter-associated surface protein [Kocuria sp. 257]
MAATSLTSLALAAGLVSQPLAVQSAIAADRPEVCSSNQAPEVEVVHEGHFDFGARLMDGTLKSAVKDDRSHPAQWKTGQNLVFALGDAAKKKMPGGMEDIAQQGSEVYLIGASQEANVPWLGWNTQDAALVDQGAEDVTMSLDSVDGPGDLSVFLTGNFGNGATPVFSTKGQNAYKVPLNTHQHGNWVFTKPGAYTATVTFTAKLKNGEQKTSTSKLRFAVGEAAVTDAHKNPGAGAYPDECWTGDDKVSGNKAAGHDPGNHQQGTGGTDSSPSEGGAGTTGTSGTNAASASTNGAQQAASGTGQLAETGPVEDAMLVNALYGVTLLLSGGLIVWGLRGGRRRA